MVQDLFTRYETHLKLVGIVFVGIHVPLLLAAIVWLGAGRPEPEVLMLWVLFGTISGLMVSVLGIWSVMRSPQPQMG